MEPLWSKNNVRKKIHLTWLEERLSHPYDVAENMMLLVESTPWSHDKKEISNHGKIWVKLVPGVLQARKGTISTFYQSDTNGESACLNSDTNGENDWISSICLIIVNGKNAKIQINIKKWIQKFMHWWLIFAQAQLGNLYHILSILGLEMHMEFKALRFRLYFEHKRKKQEDTSIRFLLNLGLQKLVTAYKSTNMVESQGRRWQGARDDM